jgi:hypothetical protein
LLDFAGPAAEIGSLMAPGAPCGQLLAAAFDQVDLLDLVQRKGTDAQFIKMAASGRNALDFHIAGYLGKLATEEPDSYFHVIAKDTGLDPLLNHMREKAVKVSRWVDVFDIPIVKARGSEPEDDKLSRIIEYLARRSDHSPLRLRSSAWMTASMCQFKSKTWFGYSVGNARCTKTPKSDLTAAK